MQLNYFDAVAWENNHLMVHCRLCPGGGIGRRARFRSVYRKMWRFEFSPGHQKYHGVHYQCERHCKKPLHASGFLKPEIFQKSERYGHQVMPLHANNAGFGQFADFKRLADLLGCKQLHHAVNLRRIGI